MHAITALVVSFALACNSHSQSAVSPPDKGSSTMTTPTPPTAPTTTLEQVQRSAPGKIVGKLDRASIGEGGVDTPGVDLFIITSPPSNRPPPADFEPSYKVVAIAGGVGSAILEGAGPILRAVEAGTKDTVVLARVGLIVNDQHGASILMGPTDDYERKINVKTPTRTGNIIDVWFYTRGRSHTRTHARLDLATGKLEPDAPQGAPTSGNPIANAIAELAMPSPSQSALETLAASCSDPAARKAFFDALAKHANERTRADAAQYAPKCGAAAVDPLIRALEHDKSQFVRGRAALALGEIGDRKAIPALEKAATTDIATSASIALRKLK